MNIERNMDLLHPLAKPAFEQLAERLRTESVFRPFETVRGPMRQHMLLAAGATRADMWKSPHQYGLAVDFVPYRDGKWSWADDEPWNLLREFATAAGLHCDFEWDRAHVEHPAWRTDFSRWMKKIR
jgi:hypothetical protein